LRTLEKEGMPLQVPPFLKYFWNTFGSHDNYSLRELMKIGGNQILEQLNTLVGELTVPVAQWEDRLKNKLKEMANLLPNRSDLAKGLEVYIANITNFLHTLRNFTELI
jgi:hypothetical protein